MRLKIAQLNWSIGANEANDLSGTGEWAVRDCEHSNLTPFGLFSRVKSCSLFPCIHDAYDMGLPNRLFLGKKYIVIYLDTYV